jgi:hypothetical protein
VLFMAVLTRKTAIQLEDKTASLPPQELAAYLQTHIGQRMTAYMLDLSDSKQVGRYVQGKHKPRHLVDQRLRAGYKVVKAIDRLYDSDTAKAWLFGTNTRLDDRAPIGLIREATDEAQLAEVWRAAQQFASADA